MPADCRKATAAWVANCLAKHPEILELVKEGLPAREIAQRVGVSPRTVSRVRNDAGLGVPRRLATENDKLRAKQLLEEGASYAEVSRTVGFGQKEVKRWFPGYTWTQQQRQEAAKMARLMAGLDSWGPGVPCRQKRPWKNVV